MALSAASLARVLPANRQQDWQEWLVVSVLVGAGSKCSNANSTLLGPIQTNLTVVFDSEKIMVI